MKKTMGFHPPPLVAAHQVAAALPTKSQSNLSINYANLR